MISPIRVVFDVRSNFEFEKANNGLFDKTVCSSAGNVWIVQRWFITCQIEFSTDFRTICRNFNTIPTISSYIFIVQV